MFPTLILVAIALMALVAWTRHRDVLHPVIFMAPFFMMFYGTWPLALNRNGAIDRLFDDRTSLEAVFFVTVTVFFGAALYDARSPRQAMSPMMARLNEAGQARSMFALSVVMGVLAFLGWMSIVGGPQNLLNAYSTGKGGGVATSGVIGESVLLSFPAVIFLALHARATGRLTVMHIILGLIFLAPHLFQGTLGGRRGPMFVSFFTLIFSYFLATGKRLRPIHFIAPAIALPIAMVVLVANRQNIYIGSEAEIDYGAALAIVLPDDDVIERNDYVHGLSTIAKADYYQDYYWGWRYFVTFFIRPIPRTIWPDKWEWVNPVWLTELDDGITFAEVTGFQAVRGASGGSIADGYQEFWWGVVVMFLILGRLFNLVWHRHRSLGGQWTVILMIMLIFSIYLPAQSFAAWGFRVMMMCLGFTALWAIIKQVFPAVRLRAFDDVLGNASSKARRGTNRTRRAGSNAALAIDPKEPNAHQS